MRLRFMTFAVFSIAALALMGCGSERIRTVMPLLPQAMPMDPPGGSGMLTLNTYAGDALAQMLLVRMGSGAGILAANLVELDDFDKTSAFGRLAAQQIGSRMGQHGFRVLDVRVASLFRMDRQGEFMLTRDTTQLLTTEYDAGAVLVGVYKVAGNRVFISARVVRIADNVLLGAYEYYMPLNDEMRALLGPAGLNAGAGGAPHEHAVWSRYDQRGGVRNPVSTASVTQAPVSYARPPAVASPVPALGLPLNTDGSVEKDAAMTMGRVIDPNSAPTPFPSGARR